MNDWGFFTIDLSASYYRSFEIPDGGCVILYNLTENSEGERKEDGKSSSRLYQVFAAPGETYVDLNC